MDTVFYLKNLKQTDLHNKLTLRADVICIYITDVTHWGIRELMLICHFVLIYHCMYISIIIYVSLSVCNAFACAVCFDIKARSALTLNVWPNCKLFDAFSQTFLLEKLITAYWNRSEKDCGISQAELANEHPSAVFSENSSGISDCLYCVCRSKTPSCLHASVYLTKQMPFAWPRGLVLPSKPYFYGN